MAVLSYSKDKVPVTGTMRYLENERIKLGIDIDLGGAITYLADQTNGGENMINSYDWGRQIQLSYYSGPWPYIGPNGEEPDPHWRGLGWNPIQSGDAGGNRSKVIEFEYRGKQSMYVRCIPMQWPHRKGIAGECEFECLYTLDNNVFTIEATIHNQRPDSSQYRACTQEMPALYTNGKWYQLVTYLGDQPFQDKPVTVVVNKNDHKGWPWVHFYTPEQWVALVDDSGKGIGVFQPEVMEFNAGFHGGDPAKGHGGTKDAQTGHIAPTARQILDHNINWTYRTSFILGTIEDIRIYAKKHRKTNPYIEWVFNHTRNGWFYEGHMKDTGWPLNNALDIIFEKNAKLVGPITFWEAGRASYLEVEGVFLTAGHELNVEIIIQPVGKSDGTDWLNWSEGNHSTEKERQEKLTKYPVTDAFLINKKIQADGTNRTYRIRLSDSPHYKGAMKNLSVKFLNDGTAQIKKIKLCN
jgi:hypothetical protein